MTGAFTDFAALLGRCHDGIAAISQQATTPAEEAERFAALLGQLAPQAVWTACLLRSEDAVSCAFWPPACPSQCEYERLIRSQLSFSHSLAKSVAVLPSEALPSFCVRIAAIHFKEQPLGFLVLALANNASAEETARVDALLQTAANLAALQGRVQALQRDRAELERFALLGQAFAGLSHELNNALNSMMLQTSVVQLRVDPSVRQEIAAIRQHGAQAAALLRSLQHLVQARREQFYPVPLNEVVVEILDEDAKLHARVSPSLSPHTPRVSGTRSAVKQLVRLVMEGVCAGADTTAKAATDSQEGGSLTLTLPKTNLNDEENVPLLETVLWQNLDVIARQAGQSLVRQLGILLKAERTEGDLLIVSLLWT